MIQQTSSRKQNDISMFLHLKETNANKTTWNFLNYGSIPMEEEMKEEGLTTDITVALYGMCAGGNKKMMG
jgi:hypothetical protein